MAISESGLHYDNDGFLVSIKSIGDTAGNVDNDLKEILKIIRERKSFSPQVIDFGDVATRTYKIKNAVVELNNQSHGVTNGRVIDVQSSVTNEKNTKVINPYTDIQIEPGDDSKPKPSAKTKDSNDILLDHQVNNIANDLKSVSDGMSEQPERTKKELENVKTSLEPVKDMAENTVKPLTGIGKMQKRSEPLSREQKEFNDDEERALGQLSQQTGKSLSLKQIIGAVPLIAVALSGALVVAIKKWWDNKDGSKADTETQEQPKTPQTGENKTSDTNIPKQDNTATQGSNSIDKQASTPNEPAKATDTPASPTAEQATATTATGSVNTANSTDTADKAPDINLASKIPTTITPTADTVSNPSPEQPEKEVHIPKNGQTTNLGGGVRREQDLSFRQPTKSKFRQAIDSVKGIVSNTIDKIRTGDGGNVEYVDPKTGQSNTPVPQPIANPTDLSTAVPITADQANTTPIEREVHIPKNGQTSNLGGGVRRVQDNRFIKYQTPLEKVADKASKFYHKIMGDDKTVVNPLLTNDVLGDDANKIVSNAVSNGASDVVSGSTMNDLYSVVNASPLPTSITGSNQSTAFSNSDKIQPISNAVPSSGESKPQKISIQNASDTDAVIPVDRLLLHSVSETISNAGR